MSTIIATENATIYLEAQLKVICDEDGRENEEVVELEKEEFIQVMLRIRVENGELWLKMQKWRNRTYILIHTSNM